MIVVIAGCRTAGFYVYALRSQQEQIYLKLVKLSSLRRKRRRGGVASYDGLEAFPSSQKAGSEIDRPHGYLHIYTYLASPLLVSVTRQSVNPAAMVLIGESKII